MTGRDESELVKVADQIISVLVDHKIKLRELDEVFDIVHELIIEQFIQKNSR